MADSRDAEAVRDTARLKPLPSLANGFADRLDQERVVFFRRQTVGIKRAPFAGKCLRTCVRCVVRMNCTQEDTFRAEARIGGSRRFRDVFLQRRGHADDVQRDFNGLLVAFLHGESDAFDT